MGLADKLKKAKEAKLVNAETPLKIVKPMKSLKPLQPLKPMKAKTAAIEEDPLLANALANVNMQEVSNKPVANSRIENYQYRDQADKCDDAEMTIFYTMMHDVVNAFEEDEIANAVENVGIYIQEHEAIQQNVLPADIGIMVKQIRINCTIAAKQVVKKKAVRTVKAVEKSEAAQLLADMGF